MWHDARDDDDDADDDDDDVACQTPSEMSEQHPPAAHARAQGLYDCLECGSLDRAALHSLCPLHNDEREK